MNLCSPFASIHSRYCAVQVVGSFCGSVHYLLQCIRVVVHCKDKFWKDFQVQVLLINHQETGFGIIFMFLSNAFFLCTGVQAHLKVAFRIP